MRWRLWPTWLRIAVSVAIVYLVIGLAIGAAFALSVPNLGLFGRLVLGAFMVIAWPIWALNTLSGQR